MFRTRPIARLRQMPPPSQRRGQKRSPCALDASVRPLGTSGSYHWTARMWDISASGISFYLKEELAIGAQLQVEIWKGQTVTGRFVARVVHATKHGRANWVIGCDLDRRLSESELAQLTAE